MRSLAILESGMVTGVGLSAKASCAAIRCAIDNFNETRFVDSDGEWIIGSAVLLDEPLRGRQKLVRMAVMAIRDCLGAARETRVTRIPLLLCVAEPNRPGRLPSLDSSMLSEIETLAGVKFHAKSAVLARGGVAIAEALGTAAKLIAEDNVPRVLIVGVDTMLVGKTLAVYEAKHRLLTSTNSDGFIPGEAAGAVLVGFADAVPGGSDKPQLLCLGLGIGKETTTIDSEEPLRGDGLVLAIKGAINDAQLPMESLGNTDYRLTDLNGAQYKFKEAALAMNRILRVRKELYEMWHPSDCIGETGAAIGPCALGVALFAARQGYAPGQGVLCHFSGDVGDRAALILQYGAPN